MIAVPTAILQTTIDRLLACGRRRNECVVFWTGERDTIVDGLVHPRHQASPGHYEVDDAWLNVFWFELGRERRRLIAQIHTHPGAAFHSPTDDVGAVAMHDGFVSIVVPNGAHLRSLAGARAYQITSSGWQEIRPLDAIMKVTP